MLEQLHDIDGLDPISIWPLALGFWIVIGLSFFLLAILIFYVLYRIAFKRSWKNDTLLKLSSLEKNLTDASAKDTLVSLSEYLRRIALRRFPRKQCASLTGENWLKWLKSHDPNKFDWESKGILLIDSPYSPLGINLPLVQIKELIQAVKSWVR